MCHFFSQGGNGQPLPAPPSASASCAACLSGCYADTNCLQYAWAGGAVTDSGISSCTGCMWFDSDGVPLPVPPSASTSCPACEQGCRDEPTCTYHAFDASIYADISVPICVVFN